MASTLASALVQGKGLNFRGAVFSGYGHEHLLSSSAFTSHSSAHLCSQILFHRHFCSPISLKVDRSSRLQPISRYPFTQLKVAEVCDVQAEASSRCEHETSEPWTTAVAFSPQNSCMKGGEKAWTQGVGEPTVPQGFTFSPLQQDTGMFFLVLLGAYIWVRMFDLFTSKKILGQKLSRKLVHITSGLLFMLCWPFFSSSSWAPYVAGLVPLANGVRLVVYGSGILKDAGLVESMSRSGDPKELLRGPLYYVLVLYTSTVVFWRQSPVGVIALALMCGGDGIADIMGRKFGSKKLPYNPDKSWAGSLAMFTFGFLVAFGCMQYFSVMGFFHLDNSSAAMRLAVISLAATIVESLPITAKLDDNFTVPVTAFGLGMLLFPM